MDSNPRGTFTMAVVGLCNPRSSANCAVITSAICAFSFISLPRNFTTTSNGSPAMSSQPSNNGRFRPVDMGLMNCVAVSSRTSMIKADSSGQIDLWNLERTYGAEGMLADPFVTGLPQCIFQL